MRPYIRKIREQMDQNVKDIKDWGREFEIYANEVDEALWEQYNMRDGGISCDWMEDTLEIMHSIRLVIREKEKRLHKAMAIYDFEDFNVDIDELAAKACQMDRLVDYFDNLGLL